MMLIAGKGSNPFTSALLYIVYIFKFYMILLIAALCFVVTHRLGWPLYREIPLQAISVDYSITKKPSSE